jgi:hypothetical protein
MQQPLLAVEKHSGKNQAGKQRNEHDGMCDMPL